ncbi:MAG TPA: hypothetical protein VGN57_00455 [Pirellulaceae bacterium]|jgi:hypothetical protein|nr:hypothetical protein [Pirellulaceae bacterium]
MAAPHVLTRILEPFRALAADRSADASSMDARGWTTIRVGLFVLVVWCGAAMMCPPPADPDLWGHVQFGRDAIQSGLERETTYAYTVEGFPWINHENLTELVLATTVDTVGPVGLLIGKFLLGAALLLVIARGCFRAGAGLVVTSAIVLLVAWNLAPFWSPRPQLATFLCFTAALCILQYAFAGWEGKWHLRWPANFRVPLLACPAVQRAADRSSIQDVLSRPCSVVSDRIRRTIGFRGAALLDKPAVAQESLTYDSRRLRALWALPVVMVVWTNSHGGWVAGCCILIAYLSLRTVEAICRKGRDAGGLIRRFALMAAAVAVATLINPYSYELHGWFVGWLGRSRGEIVEWLPPSMFDRDFLPFFLTLPVFAAALLFSRKSRDFTHVVILLIILWQASQHLRHIPFFALALAFWMPGHVQDVLDRATAGAFRLTQTPTVSRRFGAALACGFLLVACVLGWKTYERVGRLPVPRSHYPVSAFEFMERHDLGGRLIVTYNWSQYAIAAFCVPRSSSESPFPESRVQFDGRLCTCYPQEVIDLHYDLILGPPTPDRTRSEAVPEYAPDFALAYRSPDLVLLNRGQSDSVRNLESHARDWALLYQDELAQLWGRRSVFDDPASPRYLPPDLRSISEAKQTGSVAWPALPKDLVRSEPQFVERSSAVVTPPLAVANPR